MTPLDEKTFCKHHYDFVKFWGGVEKTLDSIGKSLCEVKEDINRLYKSTGNIKEEISQQGKEINSLGGFIKAYGFAIVQLLTLLSIAVKLWRG